MLTFTQPTSSPTGRNRRDFLKVGALGLTGLGLADLLRGRAMAAEGGRPMKKKSVILLFLEGGASQLETFDPKPDAPSGIRSPLGAIPTRLPGLQFGSLFPKMAQLTSKMAVVHSFTHSDGDHGGAAHWVKTGHPWPPPFFGQSGLRIPQLVPSIGSVVARAKGPIHPREGVPTYVSMRSVNGYEGDDAAWLGLAHNPFRLGKIGSNPMLADMTVKLPRERLDDRVALRQKLDALQRIGESTGMTASMDDFEKQAVSVVLGKSRQAFDLSREDAGLRERYGPGLGQDILLARRLCEAGVGFVTVNNSIDSKDIDGWDHHKDIVSSCQIMCPLVDHAVSVFIEDLFARGLDKDVLLIITGEFGRTPRFNDKGGRDHWGAVSPLILVGGGLRMGQVIGKSDAHAAYPQDRPVTPQDLMATCFHVLGIDQRLEVTDRLGRPIPMIYSGGQPIPELI